ncbi:MAG: NAD-dependent epimerase/dehydratase family protein [Oscillospiraceae bacterium]|nr:NAD-dependent epimerase/dehydratase family protein [Oscillospiraceae bacterium]
MKILITGSNGFIGKNLQVNLLAQRSDVQLLLFDQLQTLDDLREYCAQADLIFHLAGANRPDDISEFKRSNTCLTQILLEMLLHDQKATPVVFTSSTQAAQDNPYGKSKHDAEQLVYDYANKTNASVYVYRLANVFGKWCKPNYNSVVATFCYNAAHGIPLRVEDPEKELTLLYIDDIIHEFLKIVDGVLGQNAYSPPQNDQNFLEVTPTYKITLGELADQIKSFKNSRDMLTIPQDMSDPLAKKLFATFMSYTANDDMAVSVDMKWDDRGFFAELMKSPHFGQISISRTKPGIKRGDHWHNTKAEKFIVVEGSALIQMRKIGTEEIMEYPVSSDEIKVLDMPPGHTHNIINTGNRDVLTIFWTGEIFDPKDPDTIFESV